MKKEYEILDHTADTGIIACGENISEAFSNAAKAMFSLISSADNIEPLETYNIELEAPDRESLLVAWLNELIYLFDVNNILFSKFVITHFDNNSLSGKVSGQKVDPEKHEMKTGIKAATYHMLEIEENDITRVQVLFDI